ncbi:hypothetical protein D3C87_1550900 [compost metagenome]
MKPHRKLLAIVALSLAASSLGAGCARPLSVLSSPADQALDTIQEKAFSDPNKQLVSNLHAVQMALEMYAVDHSGKYPSAESFMRELTYQGILYLDEDRMPRNPFSSYELRQSNAILLPANGSPLKSATAETPTPAGSILGPGKAPHNSLHDLTTFGAIVYDYDPKRGSYVLYGIGQRGDDAVVTYVITP